MEKIKSFIKCLTEEKNAIKAVDVIKEQLDELAKEQTKLIESEVFAELGFKSIQEKEKESDDDEESEEDDEDDEDEDDEKDDD